MPLPPARTVRDDLPPTPDRCPTCDREGCRMPDIDRKILDDKQRAHIRAEHWSACWTNRVDWRARALAAEAEADSLAKASLTLDMILLDRLGARDTGNGGQTVEAGNARIVHDGMRRLDRAIADAARWRKVAPLIERMRNPTSPRASELAVIDLLAATQEPTP